MNTVLIVDDERSMRVTLSSFLKRQGLQVSVATGVCEALEKIEQETYDVVVTDLRMTGGGGVEVLKAVKRVSPATDVIIFTAFGSVDSAVEAMKLGAFDYLTKPFEPDELLLTIRRALERKRLQGEAPAAGRDPAKDARPEGGEPVSETVRTREGVERKQDERSADRR